VKRALPGRVYESVLSRGTEPAPDTTKRNFNAHAREQFRPGVLARTLSRDVPDRLRRFDAELGLEVQPGHVLHGRPARAYASRCDQDDVLFLLDRPPGLAVVHLSWSPEERPPWPRTAIYATVGEFVAAMLEQSCEYDDPDEP
jgi:hypothetical protein